MSNFAILGAVFINSTVKFPKKCKVTPGLGKYRDSNRSGAIPLIKVNPAVTALSCNNLVMSLVPQTSSQSGTGGETQKIQHHFPRPVFVQNNCSILHAHPASR